MPRTAAVAFALCLGVAPPALADTILHLSDTESVMAHPDLLVASVEAMARAETARAAQQQVNAAISAALAHIRLVPNVIASTQGYTSWQPNQQHGLWQASQTIKLTSQDAPALLTLVGELQSGGLAVSSLDWQLSPEALRAAQSAAMREALGRLRGKAEQAAAILGLRFESFQNVNIARTEPLPLPRMMSMVAAAPAPVPPTAVAQDVPVTATAEADAILVPK